jgi:hypothetical protein
LEYYRIAEDVFGAMSPTTDSGSGPVGFFQFGPKNICYGRNRSGVAKDVAGSEEFDAWKDVRRDGTTIQLPFDFAEVIGNLRLERYRQNMIPKRELFAGTEPIRRLYYLIREFLP